MLWCASNREKAKKQFEGKAVLVPQFEIKEEVVDARVGLVAPSRQVESKVEARVGADDAQPDDELQNAEVVAKGRAARLCSTWYVFAACTATALLLHAVDASNEAFLAYESPSGLQLLMDTTPLQLVRMQHTRAAVFGSVRAVVLGMSGVCVAIACLLAVHSDLLNAYPTSAKRLANCAAESTACRFLYSTAVGCTSMLAVVVAVLLLAGSAGVYALVVQEVRACGFATQVLRPAVGLVADLGDLREEVGQGLAEEVAQPHSVAQLELQAGQLVEHGDLASLCAVSAPLRSAAFFGGALCAQAAAMGTLAFGLADPDGARLAGRLINKTEQLAWQEVHSGAVPPLPLLVTDARHACYQLSLLALAADDVCLLSPRPRTLASTPHVERLRLHRALDAFRAATLALIDTSPALAEALGNVADQLAEALLGSASELLASLGEAARVLHRIEAKLDAGVAEATCALVHGLERAWVLGACGAALLAVAMVGCRLAASADAWHFYTLMPLGLLLAGVPTLGKACALLAALAAALALIAGGMAHATVSGAAAAARPMLGSVVQALLSVPKAIHLAAYLLGTAGPLLALLLSLVAWRRGCTVLSRRHKYPTWPFANAAAWASHYLLTSLRTLLAHLVGLGALLLSMGALLATGSTVGAMMYSASRVQALQAAGGPALAEQLDGFAATASTLLDDMAPLLDTAHTLARGIVAEAPLRAVFEAAHTEALLLDADYTPTCAALAAAGGVSRSHGLTSCADAMPPLALALYLLSLAGLLPMPTPTPHRHHQAHLGVGTRPLSNAQIAAATTRGLGFGAVYGGRAGAAGLGAMAAEYGGATEAYYRTLGPLCSDARLAWREVAEVCAATRRNVPAGWGRDAAPDADALRSLKHRLAETAVLVLADLDRALAPLLAPWTRRGAVHDAAQLLLYLDADLAGRLQAALDEVHQLDVAPLLDALAAATDRLVLLWLLCALAAAVSLFVCAAAWYAVSRYTLFLALVDHHAFQRAAPAWALPGALREHVRKALSKAGAENKAEPAAGGGPSKQLKALL